MKVLVMVAGCLIAAAPASAQVVRVNVSSTGTQADHGGNDRASVSGDGRFVAFSSGATTLVPGDTEGQIDIFLRDRDTDGDGLFDEPDAVSTTRITRAPNGAEANGSSANPVITPDGRYIVFESEARNLLPGTGFGVTQIYRFDRLTGALVRVSESVAGAAGNAGSDGPSVSDDGDVVAFRSAATNLAAPVAGLAGPFVREIAADRTRQLVADPGLLGPVYDYDAGLPSVSGDGTKVAYVTSYLRTLFSAPEKLALVTDIATGGVLRLPDRDTAFVALNRAGSIAVITYFQDGTRTARRVLATGAESTLFGNGDASPNGRYVLTYGGRELLDFDFVSSTRMEFQHFRAAFSADERWLVAAIFEALVPEDTNGQSDVYVIDLAAFFDADHDGMDDRWESLFGVTDPAGDPDGDGQTNAAEEDAGTHPNGRFRRYLAEGATGAFFDTRIHLANPDQANATTAVVTFDTGAGARVRRSISVPRDASITIDIGAVPGLEAVDVSTTVESDKLLGVGRTVAWGGGPAGRYGSHGETAVPVPSPTWFFAEGSTVLDFDVFYLLQNPQATTTHATVRFLLPSGATVTRAYDLRPRSRTTIYVNEVPGLGETDVAGEVSADAPIIAERAMYRSVPGQPFGLGHEAMGVTAPATSWFLAEGATGAFFDLYVLMANPTDTDASIRADYARPDGSVVTQSYVVRAHSRYSVYVDAVSGLEATSVATTLTSVNGVPIVAERAMYWPGDFFGYYEAHASAGATTTALRWVVAGGETGGPDDAQTYILIANTESRPGVARINLLGEVGARIYADPIEVSLPPTSRTTVPLFGLNSAFGALVESVGTAPVPLVVESAVYRSAGGVLWSAGSNALATPVP